MLIDELKNLKLKNWSPVLDEDEILWLELNKVRKSTNTLSSEVREEFGKILSVFEKGITRNLTNSSGVHERNSKWSPDGKYIAYISDKTGEDEIYITAQDGSENEIQLTNSKGAYKYGIAWSPDSKKILWTDRELNIKYVDVESKDEVLVFKSDRGS